MNAKSAVTNIFVEASMSGKVSMYLFHGRYRDSLVERLYHGQ